jgi:hypothetical protein
MVREQADLQNKKGGDFVKLVGNSGRIWGAVIRLFLNLI